MTDHTGGLLFNSISSFVITDCCKSRLGKTVLTGCQRFVTTLIGYFWGSEAPIPSDSANVEGKTVFLWFHLKLGRSYHWNNHRIAEYCRPFTDERQDWGRLGQVAGASGTHIPKVSLWSFTSQAFEVAVADKTALLYTFTGLNSTTLSRVCQVMKRAIQKAARHPLIKPNNHSSPLLPFSFFINCSNLQKRLSKFSLFDFLFLQITTFFILSNK